VQTFLSAHELSLCLHSSSAVFDKCRTFNSVENYSLIYGAFYQLLNSMLVHRAETMFHLVPVFVGAVKRIFSSLTNHSLGHGSCFTLASENTRLENISQNKKIHQFCTQLLRVQSLLFSCFHYIKRTAGMHWIYYSRCSVNYCH